MVDLVLRDNFFKQNLAQDDFGTTTSSICCWCRTPNRILSGVGCQYSYMLNKAKPEYVTINASDDIGDINDFLGEVSFTQHRNRRIFVVKQSLQTQVKKLGKLMQLRSVPNVYQSILFAPGGSKRFLTNSIAVRDQLDRDRNRSGGAVERGLEVESAAREFNTGQLNSLRDSESVHEEVETGGYFIDDGKNPDVCFF